MKGGTIQGMYGSRAGRRAPKLSIVQFRAIDQGNTANATRVFSFTHTPTDGNLMVVYVATAQSRTITSIPSGWTVLVDSPNGPFGFVMAKIADRETNSYSISLSGSSNLGHYGWEITDFKDYEVAQSGRRGSGTTEVISLSESYEDEITIWCLGRTGTGTLSWSSPLDYIVGAAQMSFVRYQNLIRKNQDYIGSLSLINTGCHYFKIRVI